MHLFRKENYYLSSPQLSSASGTFEIVKEKEKGESKASKRNISLFRVEGLLN